MIPHFTQGPTGVVQRLNELVEEVNKVSRIVGDGVVQVQRSPLSMTIGINREQLAALMPAGGIISKGLLAWYQFNNNAEDSSGNDHDGTFGGGMGASRYVAEFDGDDDNVDCGSDFIGTSALTICAWIRPLNAGEGNAGRIIDNGKTIFRTHLMGTKLAFTNDDSTTEYSGTSSITYHKWQHVAVTRTAAGTVNFYVNGALSGTANQASGTPVAGTSNVFIGNESDGSHAFDGEIDDVRIYNKVLAVDKIRRVMDERIKTFAHANEYHGPGITWRARTTEVAPAATNITCNLIINDGAEAGSGEFGYEIEVYCDICGGGNLNEAAPRLADNDYLAVYQSWHTDGSLRWYAETTFDTDEECVCTAPP